RNPPGDGDRLVEIPGVDQEVAAQLFARLRERAVGDEPLALADADAGRRRRGVQRGGGEKLPGRVELVRQLRRLPVTLLPLGLVQGLLVPVDQQHVAHAFASIPAFPEPLARARSPLARYANAPASDRRLVGIVLAPVPVQL